VTRASVYLLNVQTQYALLVVRYLTGNVLAKIPKLEYYVRIIVVCEGNSAQPCMYNRDNALGSSYITYLHPASTVTHRPVALLPITTRSAGRRRRSRWPSGVFRNLHGLRYTGLETTAFSIEPIYNAIVGTTSILMPSRYVSALHNNTCKS